MTHHFTDPDLRPAPFGLQARGFEQRLLRRARGLGLAPGSKIAVGFSGGADSLGLAAGLGRIMTVGRFDVHLVHVDHGIRDGSAADAERARQLAVRLGLPIVVKTLEPGLSKRSDGLGLEEAGRRERFVAFRDACHQLGTGLIALAHHRQDQAETVLLHLLRGAGLSGAAGMAALSEITVPWWLQSGEPSLHVWRPLLSEPPDEMDAYVYSLGLESIEDPTNADPRFFRNWLRQDLMPKLEVRHPGSSAGLARFAEIAAQENLFIESIAAAIFAQATNDAGGLVWRWLANEPLAMKRRVVRRWLSTTLPFQEISLERVEAVLTGAGRARPDRKIELGGHAIAVWTDGVLLAGPQESVLEGLREPFRGPIAPNHFVATRLQSGGAIEVDGWRIAAFGGGPFVLRVAEPGERFLESHRLVGEWARRNRLHALLRHRLLVVASTDGVLWAVGQERGTERSGQAEQAPLRFASSKIEEAG